MKAPRMLLSGYGLGRTLKRISGIARFPILLFQRLRQLHITPVQALPSCDISQNQTNLTLPVWIGMQTVHYWLPVPMIAFFVFGEHPESRT